MDNYMEISIPLSTFDASVLPKEYSVYRDRVNEKLDTLLKKQWQAIHPSTQRLHDALAYVINSGGKRLRPILVYTSGLALSIPIHHLDAAACAIELVHTYSLVHDDLPAMDDDDFRREKPTCHKAFEESTAILVGDALQTMAFELLSHTTLNPLLPYQQLAQIHALSKASGVQGMVGGQMLDLMAAGNQEIDETVLEAMYICKTAALIQVSFELAMLATPTIDSTLQRALRNFGKKIGLAFQIKDDLLDLEEKVDDAGKVIISSDVQQDKMTFPRLIGLDATQRKLDDLLSSAKQLLEPFPSIRDQFMPIAEFCIARNK